MAHEIETMAYAGETPWHELGTRVPADLSPAQMLEKAGLNWNVKKVPAYAEIGGEKVSIGHSALVRESDNSMLDVVSNDWNVLQNIEAFEFFHDFVANGDMEMHTAGSLKGGQFVWALAKVNDSFDLFNGDQVDSFLLFSNPHKYGWSIDVRFTPIRVVCNNTLTLSLNTASKNFAKISHRRAFDGDLVKETLGIAKEKLSSYREMAQMLGGAKYTMGSLTEYFNRVFPVAGAAKKKVISANAAIAHDVIYSQPGANFAEGSLWQAFNAVTYMVDHKLGRSQDNRLANAWFGYGKKTKDNALQIAVEMAEAA